MNRVNNYRTSAAGSVVGLTWTVPVENWLTSVTPTGVVPANFGIQANLSELRFFPLGGTSI